MGSLDALFSTHQNALRLRAQRQEVLAANIANADTPNYKARDFDFKSALKNAVGNTQPASQLKTTSSGHISGGFLNSSGVDLKYRNVIQGSVDGNTVDMDVERNQFADNAIRYEAGVNMVNGNIKKMMSAIQGQ